MQPIRQSNVMFAALRLVGFLMCLLLALAILLAPDAPGQAEPTAAFERRFPAGALALLSLFFGISFLRATLWVELSAQGATVRRVLGLRRHGWADVQSIMFETSRASVNFVPVAHFRTMTVRLNRGSFYVRVTADDEARLQQFLAQSFPTLMAPRAVVPISAP